MYRSILVIADQDCNQRAAMRKARSAAFCDGVDISVVASVQPCAGGAADTTGEKNTEMQQAIDTVFAGIKKVSYDVAATHDIAAFSKALALENDIDLVIKTGNRTESLFYTPLDCRLLRELECPVMISRSLEWRAKQHTLVTVDINSKKAHPIALNAKVPNGEAGWPQTQRCELHVAFCIDVPKAMIELDVISKNEVLVKKEKEMTEKLQPFLDEHDVTCSSISFDAGNPRRLLSSLANSLKSDLVVLNSVGRKGIKGTLLVNTAEKVMSKLRTDLFVVHPYQ